MRRIDVASLVGENAISLQSGTKLYEKIYPEMVAGRTLELDFKDVKIFASPFFNSSIGLMLKDISIDDMKLRLNIVGMDANGLSLLNHVIANAISFYSNKPDVNDVLNERSED